MLFVKGTWTLTGQAMAIGTHALTICTVLHLADDPVIWFVVITIRVGSKSSIIILGVAIMELINLHVGENEWFLKFFFFFMTENEILIP